MKKTKLQNCAYLSNLFLIFAISLVFCTFTYSQSLPTAENSGYSSSSETKNIRELDLSSKKLNSVPDEIFEMTNLEILDLHDNPITVLSDYIRRVQNLRVLNLAGTNITELPEGISQLYHLEEIHLSYFQWEYSLDKVKKLTKAKIILE